MDSELVCRLMPGADGRMAVSPFVWLSNVTNQDLFDIIVVKDVRECMGAAFFYLVCSFKRNNFYTMIVAGKCPLYQSHVTRIPE